MADPAVHGVPGHEGAAPCPRLDSLPAILVRGRNAFLVYVTQMRHSRPYEFAFKILKYCENWLVAR